MFYQGLAVAFTVLLTYAFFRAFGERNHALVYSRDEKSAWDRNLRRSLGGWLVVTSVTGSLTSLATYVFLTGQVKVFGWFSAAAAITIALGALVTNRLTYPVWHSDRFQRIYADGAQVSGVIANIFWRPDAQGRFLAKTIRALSLASTLAIVWLEFSAFVELTAHLHGIDDFGARAAICALLVFVVLLFVLRYGIRGFVFADLLHAPLIAVSSLAVLGGAVGYLITHLNGRSLAEVTAPLPLTDVPLPYGAALLFTAHVVVLNGLQVVCSEHHWFRLWLLGEQELKRQVSGSLTTGALWLLLLPIGFAGFMISQEPGSAAIGGLLAYLNDLSPIFPTLFWVAATGALFSTADIQIYSSLLLWRYDGDEGVIRDLAVDGARAFVIAVGAAALFGLLYYAVHLAGFPLEKVLFVVVPFAVNLSPLFIARWAGRRPSANLLIASTALYSFIAGAGFLFPATNFVLSLSAIFVPPALTVLALPLLRREPEVAAT